jgi:hypothetical protein
MHKLVFITLCFFGTALHAQAQGTRKSVNPGLAKTKLANPGTPALTLKTKADSVSYAVGINIRIS